MKDKKGKVHRADGQRIAEYFKPAYIEMVGVEKDVLEHPSVAKNMPNIYPKDAFTPKGKIKQLEAFVNTFLKIFPQQRYTTLRLFYVMEVANYNKANPQHPESSKHKKITEDTKGIATGLPPKNCFVFGDRLGHKPADVALVGAHELTHGFNQSDEAYYGFDNKGHDTHDGFKGGACLMRALDAGKSYCLKHLEALRRQRYGEKVGDPYNEHKFFDAWREELDKRR